MKKSALLIIIPLFILGVLGAIGFGVYLDGYDNGFDDGREVGFLQAEIIYKSKGPVIIEAPPYEPTDDEMLDWLLRQFAENATSANITILLNQSGRSYGELNIVVEGDE